MRNSHNHRTTSTTDLKLATQYEVSDALLKHAAKFLDLNDSGRYLLTIISTTIGGPSSEVKTNLSHYTRATGKKWETIRNLWEELIALGYIRETTDQLSNYHAYLNKDLIRATIEGFTVPEKYKRHTARGVAKAAHEAKEAANPVNLFLVKDAPVEEPVITEQAKATVTPITKAKPTNGNRELVQTFNRTFGTEYTYNGGGGWCNDTNSNIPFETLREQLKLKGGDMPMTGTEQAPKVVEGNQS